MDSDASVHKDDTVVQEADLIKRISSYTRVWVYKTGYMLLHASWRVYQASLTSNTYCSPWRM